LLDAIGRGDLNSVKKLAGTVTKEKVPNLLYHAPGSPNPEVVEFLRSSYELQISDLQVAAIRGGRMEVRRLLAQLDEPAKKAALVQGCIHGLLSNSPLALAVRNGHTDAVRELIAAGAEVNEYCIWTLTPLANAAERGHTEIVNPAVA
jgi:ankyrin repeat protein